MPALLSLVVIETESGAEVRVRDSEEAGEAYPTLRAALDLLLTDGEYKPKAGILRDDAGEQVGVWRWLDATAEEPAPLEDGSQVTRDLIAKMAAGLNAGSPVPIDGGTSPAHAQAWDGTVRADGYAHVGAEVRDRSGRWHLFAYAELAPAVARDTDAGLLAYGSVAFTSAGRLIQHALTNTPAVEGLSPNNAIRAPRGVRVFIRSTRITMPTNDAPKKPALRATLAEAEPMLLELTGESPETLGTALIEIVAANKAKKAEEAAESEAEAKPAEMSADASAQRSDATVTPPAARADGFADAAEMEAFVTSALGTLRDVFGQPEASPAQLLELLTASSAAFKGALGNAAPPADADPSAMSQEPAARALAADVTSLRSKVAHLESELAKRDMRSALAKRASEAKALIADADLDQLVSDALAVSDTAARERIVATAIRAAQNVPTGRVFSQRTDAMTSARSLVEAAEQLLPEIRKEHPGKPEHVLVSIAQRTARARFPHLSA